MDFCFGSMMSEDWSPTGGSGMMEKISKTQAYVQALLSKGYHTAHQSKQRGKDNEEKTKKISKRAIVQRIFPVSRRLCKKILCGMTQNPSKSKPEINSRCGNEVMLVLIKVLNEYGEHQARSEAPQQWKAVPETHTTAQKNTGTSISALLVGAWTQFWIPKEKRANSDW